MKIIEYECFKNISLFIIFSTSLSWYFNQLRGEAGKRQVEGARIGLQHNFGIGGAAVVTMYRAFGVQPSSKL